MVTILYFDENPLQFASSSLNANIIRQTSKPFGSILQVVSELQCHINSRWL